MGDLTRNFSRKEFECNPRECGCGYDDIDLDVVLIGAGGDRARETSGAGSHLL